MHRITALLFLALISFAAKSQSESERILGTFVFEKKAYNYEFTKENENNFSFVISGASLKRPPKPAEKDSTQAETKDKTGKEAAADKEAVQESDESDSNVKADTLEDHSGDSATYIFSEFTKPTFEAIFMEQMIHVIGYDSAKVAGKLRDKASEIFFSIQARLGFIDDEPVTAYLILRKDSIKSFLKTNTSAFYDGELAGLIARHQVQRVDVETEDGAIKNIKVHLVKPDDKKAHSPRSPRSFLEFKNRFPISISGKFDAEKFAKINLYCMNCGGIKGLSRYIQLSDLLILDIELENDKEDYSPSNRKVSLTTSNPIQELRKEKRSRILEIASFTDLAGLDQDQPNGLIQIEAKRKININTKSHLLFGKRDESLLEAIDASDIKRYWIDNPEAKRGKTIYKIELKSEAVKNKSKDPGDGKPEANTVPSSTDRPVSTASTSGNRDKEDKRSKKEKDKNAAINGVRTVRISRHPSSPYFILFSSIEPRLLFSKLEENNRVLDSSSFQQDTLISPLKLYQYQLWSFGASLNILKLSFPQAKLSWNVINVGGAFFRTRAGTQTDSTSQSVPLNSSYFILNTNVVFRPDNRWGASFGFDYVKTSLWNDSFALSNRHALLQPYFDGYIKTSDNAKLFFRFRWIYEQYNRSSNFAQIQIGYSMNIFATPSGASKK